MHVQVKADDVRRRASDRLTVINGQLLALHVAELRRRLSLANWWRRLFHLSRLNTIKVHDTPEMNGLKWQRHHLSELLKAATASGDGLVTLTGHELSTLGF